MAEGIRVRKAQVKEARNIFRALKALPGGRSKELRREVGQNAGFLDSKGRFRGNKERKATTKIPPRSPQARQGIFRRERNAAKRRNAG